MYIFEKDSPQANLLWELYVAYDENGRLPWKFYVDWLDMKGIKYELNWGSPTKYIFESEKHYLAFLLKQ